MDIGLQTQISGLRSQYANQAFAVELNRLTESDGIVRPDEGCHSDLLHDQVLKLFQELGYDWVWIGDEFCTQRKLHWIDYLIDEDVETFNGHCNVFTPDKSLLWTVHWCSHFSFLASSTDILTRIGVDSRLEGVYCTPDTEVDWSIKKARPTDVPESSSVSWAMVGQLLGPGDPGDCVSIIKYGKSKNY